jgi:hypothetical protein
MITEAQPVIDTESSARLVQTGGGVVTAVRPVGVVRLPSGSSRVVRPGAWCFSRWWRVQ